MSDQKQSDPAPEQTLALIKPNSFARSDEIIQRILDEGFSIIQKKQVSLTKQRAGEFYAEHKGKPFYDALTGFMSSGSIYALKLEKINAIKDWRSLMGPTKIDLAKKNAPNSIRATFAADTTKNSCHGSDSVNSSKRELDFFFNYQQTLALIKPDAVKNGKADEIIERIKNEQFLIIEQQKLTLTKDRAEAFYAEHKGKGFYDDLVAFMISGPIYALKLEKKDGIKAWRDLMGPTNYQTAKKDAPNSIRALYATDMTMNASHGSDSVASAVRELNFFFPQQRTLALIKPDAVKAGNAGNIINRIVQDQFQIIEQKKVYLYQTRAEAFYAEHKGKGFFDDLVAFMCSGPIYALKLQGTNGIKKWRDLMGPTNYQTAKKDAPNSIRALYATNMTMNASHGSDSVASASRELEFYFPTKANEFRSSKQYTLALIKPDAVSAGNADAIINRIKYEGFGIIKQQKLKLTKDRAEAFYAEHKGKSFFNGLIAFMISGDTIALKLERENAIKCWRSTMGPTNFETAKKTAPNSIRALYASSTTKNASHGSDSPLSAKRELDFYFS